MVGSDKPRQEVLLGYMNALLGEEVESRQDTPRVKADTHLKLDEENAESLIKDECLASSAGAVASNSLVLDLPSAVPALRLDPVDKADENDASALSAASARTWAQGEFDALLIKVAGVSVAVPLFQVQKIHKISAPLVKLVNHPDWLLGLYSHRGHTIQVLDIRQLISVKSTNAKHDWQAGHIVVSENGRFGFACEEVDKIIKLENKDVRWRSSVKNKVWYLGIISEYMCIFVDIQQLLTEKTGSAPE